MHHLRFCASSPGIVFCREKANSPEVSISLLKKSNTPVSFDEDPEILVPAGLSVDRQWYLYNKIREFCPDRSKDVTCPLPSYPQPPSPPPEERTPSRSPSPVFIETVEPSTKRARLCGLCHKTGHNARTCPTK